jgi:hypothetical protein
VTPPDGADSRHLHCWYSRRSARLPAELGFHTIEDGLLVSCAHPMMFPVVGYHFDIRNCDGCEYYRPAMPRKPRHRR